MIESDALARLAELETRFETILEAEKLAALAEFAAGAGHEINNPLAVIVGRAQLLLRDETQPDRRRDLATIAAQAMRVHEMIADLMLFARPPRPEFTRQAVFPLVARVADESRSRAALKDAVLTCEGESLALLAAVDGAQIEVAVRAVVANAIEALTAPGTIRLIVAEAQLANQPAVEIAVHDDGPGIPAEVRRHLFDPFFSGRQAGRGLGLGLSKCWRIVTLHGGAVTVDSESGQGATVRITLPCEH